MTHLLIFSSIWLLIATCAAVLSRWLKLVDAISEILMGVLLGFLLTKFFGFKVLDPAEDWIRFIGMGGALFLTFLAGLELDPHNLKKHGVASVITGLLSFFVPFIICSLTVYFIFGWTKSASLLAGIALATTSVAVVYTVLLELGLNTTEYAKKLLIACFVTDIVTVLTLTLIFTSYTLQTLLFIFILAIVLFLLPLIVKDLFKRFGGNSNEFETKFLLLCLFSLSAYASYVKLEPVLPAYLIGVTLAGTLGGEVDLVKRLRTLTFGLLTPFYFISIGLLVSLPSLVNSGWVILLLLCLKIVSKLIGVYPSTIYFKASKHEGLYAVLLMSTGLTFGTIAALFGLTHQIVTLQQYSILVTVVVGSAVVPTICAFIFFKKNSKKKITLK